VGVLVEGTHEGCPYETRKLECQPPATKMLKKLLTQPAVPW
jgi:hypothetical protein